MRDAENIRQVETLDIDLMGFIFWPKSSRYVSEHPAYLPMKCKRVGVFVDEEIETVKRIADEYALDYIQLHGHESPSYCAQLQGLHLIKAISVSGYDDISAYKRYEELVDYFLFDTRMPSRGVGCWLPPGGTGQKFDWSVLSAYDGNTPFLLSGGICSDDVERVKMFYHPQCVGVDLNSRFELAPGFKDINTLKKFLEQL